MKNDRNVVFGKHPVMRAFEEPNKVEKVFMLQEAKGPLEMEVREFCTKNDIPLIKTKEAQLNKICSSRNHQGILAIIAPVSFQNIEDIIPHLFESNQVPLILMLDRVTDVRNFGAIARSAEILGCQAIIIPKKGAAAITKDAIKASAGAIFDVAICRDSILEDTIDFLKNSGLQAVSLIMNGDKALDTIDLKQPTVFIMGSEEHGVKRELLKISNHVAEIKQLGKTESLNVSVATGICLYEAQRQRSFKS